jgi:hypothetical protein
MKFGFRSGCRACRVVRERISGLTWSNPDSKRATRMRLGDASLG